jgi:hypothetical protein
MQIVEHQLSLSNIKVREEFSDGDFSLEPEIRLREFVQYSLEYVVCFNHVLSRLLVTL